MMMARRNLVRLTKGLVQRVDQGPPVEARRYLSRIHMLHAAIQPHRGRRDNG